ncbi:penicillin-binding protein activator [Roseococcus sp. DSY-14]|uniref:penicillin-binding protein activator n=1 Tax=Roseococcus sp. DSY-14 TaxID=3369650 RepID=UPI00387B8937
MRRLPWLLGFLALIGCAPQPQGPGFPATGPQARWAPPPMPGDAAAPRSRVALLLPLSGPQAPLGEAMQNAATLALFEGGDRGVEFLPRDTRSSSAGAADAARQAVAEGARAVAGPLTLQETAAVSAATGGQLPVFAFTSDEAQAGPATWVLGITPTQQARRVMQAALGQGARRFALLAPEDAFGQRLADAMRRAAAEAGLPPPVIQFTAARGGDLAGAAEALAAQLPDAVLLGGGGAFARQAAPALATAFGGRPPRLLGTSLWATEPGLGNEPALAGALFPGPDPAGRGRFEAAYAGAFGAAPPRTAGVAYDGAALAARAARAGAPPLGEPFMGADGPIQLRENGVLARGLAVFALRPGADPQLVQAAPAGAGS